MTTPMFKGGYGGRWECCCCREATTDGPDDEIRRLRAEVNTLRAQLDEGHRMLGEMIEQIDERRARRVSSQDH